MNPPQQLESDLLQGARASARLVRGRDEPSVVVAVESPTLDELYQQLKSLEGQIPVPAPSARVWVGTLDAGERVFHWSLPVKRETFPGGLGGSPVTLVGTASVDAVNVDLIFAVRNRQTDFEVSGEGYEVRAPETTPEIRISVGTANRVPFTVRSGGVSFHGVVELTRYAHGVGAFTIDAIPIALVYPPVQGETHENRISYQHAELVGTKMGFSLTYEDTDTQIGVDTLHQIGDGAGRLAEAIGGESIPGKVLKAFSGLISAIGTDTLNVGTALRTTYDHQVENKQLDSDLIRTPVGAGPGEGLEIFLLLQNIQAAYLVTDGNLSIAIFNTPELSRYPSEALAADLDELERRGASPEERGERTRLMNATLRDLLRLNPYWTPSSERTGTARLASPRFRRGDMREGNFVGPTDEEVEASATMTVADTRAQTRTYTHVHDVRRGFLAFLGYGPSEDRTMTWSSSGSNLEERTIERVTSTTLMIKLEREEVFRIAPYYDRLFGTFAFAPTEREDPAAT